MYDESETYDARRILRTRGYPMIGAVRGRVMFAIWAYNSWNLPCAACYTYTTTNKSSEGTATIPHSEQLFFTYRYDYVLMGQNLFTSLSYDASLVDMKILKDNGLINRCIEDSGSVFQDMQTQYCHVYSSESSISYNKTMDWMRKATLLPDEYIKYYIYG